VNDVVIVFWTERLYGIAKIAKWMILAYFVRGAFAIVITKDMTCAFTEHERVVAAIAVTQKRGIRYKRVEKL
jgi:hypothetical protein